MSASFGAAGAAVVVVVVDSSGVAAVEFVASVGFVPAGDVFPGTGAQPSCASSAAIACNC